MENEYVVISPYSADLSSWGKNPNPKNFPYWAEIVEFLKSKNLNVIQIGAGNEKIISEKVDVFLKDLPFEKLKEVLKGCKFWMAVDNMLQHFVACEVKGKKGVVIFGTSDPNIFGYPENINILKSRNYLRPNQFLYWFYDEFNPEVFPTADEVIAYINSIL